MTGDDLVGHALAGRYRLEGVLGRGGMGVVYRGRDETLGRPVAVKVIQPGMDPADPQHEMLRKRFRREAAAAARVPPHPNVVQVFDFGTDPERGVDFLVMELLSGHDLKERLTGGGLAPGERIPVLIAAARGLAAGHAAGLVHRDVKPANLFLIDDQTGPGVKVLDFGIAKAWQLGGPEEELTVAGTLPHTPAYASPEQAMGRPVTPAADVYQLGLLAYEVLAGERPFGPGVATAPDGGNTALALPARGRWASVPPAVRQVVERALEPDPRARFPDAREFGNALLQAVAEPTTEFTAPADDTMLAVGATSAGTVLAPRAGSSPQAERPAGFRAAGEGAMPGAASSARYPVGAWSRSRAVWVAALVGLGAIIWAARSASNDEPATGLPMADTPAETPVDPTLRRLQSDAAERLQDGG